MVAQSRLERAEIKPRGDAGMKLHTAMNALDDMQNLVIGMLVVALARGKRIDHVRLGLATVKRGHQYPHSVAVFAARLPVINVRANFAKTRS